MDLTPTGSQAEADPDKGKTNHHVPGTDIWNRILGLGDIEGHDPQEADQEVSDHGRGQPTRALHLERVGLANHLWGLVVLLLLTQT